MIRFGDETDIMDSAPFLIKTIEGQDNDISFIISLPFESKKGVGIYNTGIYGLNEILADCVYTYPDKNNTYEIIFEDYEK